MRRGDGGERGDEGEAPGDAVVGGAVNGVAAFLMRAERVGAETLLARDFSRRGFAFNNFKNDTYEFSAEVYYKKMQNQIE